MKFPQTVAELFHVNRLTDRYDGASTRFLEFYKSAIDLQIGALTQGDEKCGSETWLPLTDDNHCHLSSNKHCCHPPVFLFSEPQVLTINLPRDADPPCLSWAFKHYMTTTGNLPSLAAGVVTRRCSTDLVHEGGVSQPTFCNTWILSSSCNTSDGLRSLYSHRAKGMPRLWHLHEAI